MRIKKLFSWKVILMIAVVLSMILVIGPRISVNGLRVSSVSGEAYNSGLSEGNIIYSINKIELNDLSEFSKAIDDLTKFEKKIITVETTTNTTTYEITNSLGFKADNLTIISADKGVNLDVGSKIISINNNKINNSNDLFKIQKELIKDVKITLGTNKGDVTFLSNGKPDIQVKKVERTNIKRGLDLVGGIRVLLKPEENLNEKDMDGLVSILNNRLDVYGLSDINIRSAKDLSGETFILAEIAGATKEEVETLIAKQGKFEAKIGNLTVFEGGKRDIPFVCRGDGSCSGVVPPCDFNNGQYNCKFEFTIRLSGNAAKKHAEITRNIPDTAGGYLEKNLDLYLDDKLVDTLRISNTLKGQEATAIAISGPGAGGSQQEAYRTAIKNMDKLQTVLITGSLPQKVNIIKIDNISPLLGEEFVSNIFYVFLAAIFGVIVVTFARYRRLKIIIPMIITMMSEIIIILGFAALIGWNLDLVSIAGIITAVGTGVDDQIVIVDELLNKQQELNWKRRLKNAFFIVLAAYATTVAAMIPLWNAGAGIVRGLALTTIVGITAGVFITRPAFGSIVESLLEEE
ncbi:hypothetical protein HYX16_02300 [Candidatus Woesearchaeota archaeon]|nr:hypothetical protein [Candidatus Woesearchaeota archaeon]